MPKIIEISVKDDGNGRLHLNVVYPGRPSISLRSNHLGAIRSAMQSVIAHWATDEDKE